MKLRSNLLLKSSCEESLQLIRSWLIENQPEILIHPLGFFVVLLHRDDREELRFHVWPRGLRTFTGPPFFIHTHTSEIHSKILKGNILNISYQTSIEKFGEFRIYEVTYHGDKYSSVGKSCLEASDERVIATEIYRELIPVGKHYTVPSHFFHCAVASDKHATCTVVRTYNRAPGKAKVLGTDGYPKIISFERKVSTIKDILDAFEI